METQVVETLELLATRIKGRGDSWILVGDAKKVVHPSLTDALEAWFEKNQEQVEFRLAPLDSKLYVICRTINSRIACNSYNCIFTVISIDFEFK